MRFVPLVLLIFINSLFVWKYGARTGHGPFLTVLAVSAMITGFAMLPRLPEKLFSRQVRYIYLGMFSIGLLFIWNRIAMESIQVDRWSAIPGFFDALFSGQFPYAARTHLGNGFTYFPVFFVAALPFYFLGEIGLMSLMAVVGYCCVTEKMMDRERDRFLSLLFITLMPALLWEYTVRSTLLFNTVLLLIYFQYAEKYSPHKNWTNTVIFGTLAGLVLSTRAVFGLLLLAYVAHTYLRNKKEVQGAVFLALAGIVLGLSLLPFALWDWGLFQANNPFLFQASFIPTYTLPLLVLLAVWMGYKAHNIGKFYRSVGILLFVTVASAFLDSLFKKGWDSSIVQNGFDISYFIFSAPFLTVALYLSGNGNARLEPNA